MPLLWYFLCGGVTWGGCYCFLLTYWKWTLYLWSLSVWSAISSSLSWHWGSPKDISFQTWKEATLCSRCNQPQHKNSTFLKLMTDPNALNQRFSWKTLEVITWYYTIPLIHHYLYPENSLRVEIRGKSYVGN